MSGHRHHGGRERVKRNLARLEWGLPAAGLSLLIYHRIGAETQDELDVPKDQFLAQLRALEDHDVISLDEGLDRVERRDPTPSVVLTFDDGFRDVYENAWPALRERRLPFTIYLTTAYMGEQMVWEGSTAQGPPGMGMTWRQLEEMLASGLCTIGNHTHNHVRPEKLTVDELDQCSAVIEHHLGVRPVHFTYPWGVVVPRMEAALRERFRSSSTGILGRNDPSTDFARLKRIPVRQSDPIDFFKAKVTGTLRAERLYAGIVAAAKIPGRLRSSL